MRALESKQMLKMSSFGTNTRKQTDKSGAVNRNRVQQIVKCDSPVQRDCWKKYSDSDVELMWFTDEQMLTVAKPQKSPEWSFVRSDCVKKEITPERLLYAHTRLSASRWWCPSVCQSWGKRKRSWYSSILQWRSMPHITVMCFSLNSYCMSCRRSRETSSSCSKTVLQRTTHATQSNFLNGIHPHSLHQTSGPPIA